MKNNKNIREYSLGLLAKRDYTEQRIKEKFFEKKYSEEEIAESLKWLKEKDFINDDRFTENYVKCRILNIKTGKQKLYFKLKQLGIGKELIEKHLRAVKEEDELEKAKELSKRWLVKNEEKDKKYERLGHHLAGKGYEIDVIREVLGKILNS